MCRHSHRSRTLERPWPHQRTPLSAGYCRTSKKTAVKQAHWRFSTHYDYSARLPTWAFLGKKNFNCFVMFMPQHRTQKVLVSATISPRWPTYTDRQRGEEKGEQTEGRGRGEREGIFTQPGHLRRPRLGPEGTGCDYDELDLQLRRLLLLRLLLVHLLRVHQPKKIKSNLKK